MSGIEFEVWGKRQSDLVAKNLSQMNLFYIYDLLAARGTHFQFYKVLKKLVNFYKSECDMHTRSDTMKPKLFWIQIWWYTRLWKAELRQRTVQRLSNVRTQQTKISIRPILFLS